MSEQSTLTSQLGSVLYGYACPITHSPLKVLNNNQLKSIDEGRCYKIDDGIPDFLSFPAKENKEEVRKLQILVDAGREHGCERALRECEGESANYVLDINRAKYLDLLPIDTQSRVLEIGASKGQHTRLIAKRCKFLHAIDVVMGQMVFAREWCNQLGCTNVSVAVGGDDSRLPYLDGIFDVVVLNYVFEWCASRTGKNPIDGQKLLLAECNRVLKPGGCLFLSTKNRYSARLLLGARDEHVDFPFGNALPRWLMQLALRLKGRSHPDGLLHSHSSLRRMIVQNGFSRVASYWAIPNARFPLAYPEFDTKEIADARTSPAFRNVDLLTKFLLKRAPTRLIKTLAASHVFVAHKGDA